ncbi:hypothetical protein ACFX5U_13965 [Sphingobacterium sp. SG20118]|uniref:hypothetical protein n=1 Tax=Sphingobacterium TaxID=28453 RepID=UPI000A841C6B|nr:MULTISPECIES: hypothetical protein [Sphingobacterium]MDH5826076.1 hypothetical protein [Sphingobacterium faecium]
MTNLIIQYIIVGAIIIVAIIYFSKTMRASFSGKKTCGKGCGCDMNKAPINNKSNS